jgi:hypothetical protein
MSGTRRATVARSPKAKREPAMIILRGVPKGYHWGWFSREDPRMHLQVVDRPHSGLGYKVWLEEKGKRIFEPAGPIPASILKRLRTEVASQRRLIEDNWTGFMMNHHWLHLTMSGSVITLTAYPAFPGSRFQRTVDLAEYLAGIYDPTYPMVPKKPVRPDEVVLSNEVNAIEIWPQKHESLREHIYLPPILWQDK